MKPFLLFAFILCMATAYALGEFHARTECVQGGQ